MRFILTCLVTLPALPITAAHAETITLDSAPTSAVVYGYGAQVTREVAFSIAAGQHEVILPDLPEWLRGDMLRVGLDGATLGSSQFRASAVPPQPENDSPAIVAAKARIEEARQAITALDDRVAEAKLAATAAEAKIGFLAALGSNQGLPDDVTVLTDVARMIEAETLSARQKALNAQQQARDIEKGRADLMKALKDAIAALAALTPPPTKSSHLTLALSSETAADVTLSLSYPVDAGWRPVYDLYLSGSDPARLDISRGAMIAQYSGENWEDVAVTLSTLEPLSQIAPSVVRPQLRRIEEPAPTRPMPTASVQGKAADMEAAPMMEAPVRVSDGVTTSFSGPGITYRVGRPLDLASGVDDTRVMLDELTFEADRFARAAPAEDPTAFLMAAFVNTTKEPLLYAEEAALYIDNTLVGRSRFAQVPAGGEGDVAFGPIEDLRLTYTVIDQSEGDRGIISRSNAQRQQARMDIENLGSTNWQVEVRAAVPYAIQDDLNIIWTATPAPDETDVEDQRGVLQWQIDVPAGTEQSITVQQELNWPDGMVLR